jgi:hypothetical protein
MPSKLSGGVEAQIQDEVVAVEEEARSTMNRK